VADWLCKKKELLDYWAARAVPEMNWDDYDWEEYVNGEKKRGVFGGGLAKHAGSMQRYWISAKLRMKTVLFTKPVNIRQSWSNRISWPRDDKSIFVSWRPEMSYVGGYLGLALHNRMLKRQARLRIKTSAQEYNKSG